MTYSHQAIHQRLTSKNPDDRRVAAVMIGKARRHDYADSLMDLLRDDESADVRAMAAFALDLLSTVDALPALIEAMYDTSFDVRSNAGWAIVNIAKRVIPLVVLPDVIEVLQDRDFPHAQQMAYLVLTRIPHDAARSALEKYWH